MRAHTHTHTGVCVLTLIYSNLATKLNTGRGNLEAHL